MLFLLCVADVEYLATVEYIDGKNNNGVNNADRKIGRRNRIRYIAEHSGLANAGKGFNKKCNFYAECIMMRNIAGTGTVNLVHSGNFLKKVYMD
jgi:hypothetical protein